MSFFMSIIYLKGIISENETKIVSTGKAMFNMMKNQSTCGMPEFNKQLINASKNNLINKNAAFYQVLENSGASVTNYMSCLLCDWDPP